MTVFVGEDPALPEAEIDECEAVISCLGDDAALLRAENPDCEIAANMNAAADMLERERASQIHGFAWVMRDADIGNEFLALHTYGDSKTKAKHSMLAMNNQRMNMRKPAFEPLRVCGVGVRVTRGQPPTDSRFVADGCEPFNSELRHAALRALVAWDGTVLPKAHDGLMQERMECLRAALADLGA